LYLEGRYKFGEDHAREIISAKINLQETELPVPREERTEIWSLSLDMKIMAVD